MSGEKRSAGGQALKPAYLKDPKAAAAYPVGLIATWPRHNAGRYTEPLYDRAGLAALLELVDEVLGIADKGETPDGDGVNVPTLLWAEGWRRRLRAGAQGDATDGREATGQGVAA